MNWFDIFIFSIPLLLGYSFISHLMTVYRPSKNTYRIKSKYDGFNMYIDPFVLTQITFNDEREYIIDVKTLFGWKTVSGSWGDGTANLNTPYLFNTENEAEQWMKKWYPKFKKLY